MALTLRSTAFESNDLIPTKYTCDGTNVSPPLTWHGVPDAARTLVLLCDDPDSARNPWSHWVIYNMPPSRDTLEEGVATDAELAWGAAQGRNDFGDIGYGGPCPGSGTHHYYFRLYALDTELVVPPGATRAQVLNLIEGHILAESELMGRYARG